MKKVLALVLLVLTSCSRNQVDDNPAPRVTESGMNCPETMWKSGDIRPANIEVINQSQDSVLVFLDRCRGHTRVGEVAGGESRLLEMPDGALSFSGMLRFYTYRGAERRVAVELASTDADPHLRLVLPETAETGCPQVVVDGKLVSPNIRIPRDSIASMTYEPSSEGDLRSCGRIIVKTRP